MRGLALALIVTLSSCAFGARHPAMTAGIVGATLGFSTCEIGTDFEGAHGTCAGVSAGAALLLGGEGNTVLRPDEDTRPALPSIDDLPPPVSAPVDPTSVAPTPTEPAPAPTP